MFWKSYLFPPGSDREVEIQNFALPRNHTCAYSIWKHIVPFSLSLESDQINGHRRSVADLSIKKPFEACPKKEIQNCCGASSMCTVLAWRHYFLYFWIWTPMVSLWRWWSHSTNKAEVTSCWSIISRNKNALFSILVFLRHDWCGSCNQTRFVSQLLSYVNVYCFVGCTENRIRQGVWLGWSWNHLRR